MAPASVFNPKDNFAGATYNFGPGAYEGETFTYTLASDYFAGEAGYGAIDRDITLTVNVAPEALRHRL